MSLLQLFGASGAGSRRRIVEHASDQALEMAARFWAWLVAFVAPKRPVVLAPYRRARSLRSMLTVGALVLLLGFFCLVYGFFFGLAVPFVVTPFLIPLGVLALLIIWALPDQRRAPTYGLELLLPATLIVLILWPDYVAVSLKGLPWITLLRFMTIPMAGLLLICVSVSSAFRRELAATIRETKPLWLCLAGFVAVQIVTIAMSDHKMYSLQTVTVFQLTCTSLLVIGAVLFRKTEYIERYFGLLCALGVPIAMVSLYEYKLEHLPWMTHIPGWLQIPDPSVKLILQPSFRMYIDKYRVHATFRTPLALAEYLSLLTPLLLHFMFTARHMVWRVVSALLIPLFFFVIRSTDARLGVVGVFGSVLLYGLVWSLLRWRSRPRDLLSAAILYAYPATFTAAVGLIFASYRLRTMVLGDGAQAGSTDARNTQLMMALPKVAANPFGYGAGQCGEMIGFAPGDFITIDNYFVSLILDYGVIGTICWYGMFITAIVWAVRYCTHPEYASKPEARWLAPLGVTMATFLIIKWVHGQSDNHPIYFMMLGMVAALVYRLRVSQPEAQTSQALAPVRAFAVRSPVLP